MTLYCLPTCTTCKRAVALLQSHDLAFEYRNIRTEKPSRAVLVDLIKRSARPIKVWFNTSGDLYRSLNLSVKLPSMSEDEMIDLLASDGMLIRRPILVTEHTVLVGFKEEAWESIIGA